MDSHSKRHVCERYATHYNPNLGGKCAPLHTNTLKDPHGLNLRADTGWSAVQRESRRLARIKAPVGVFQFILQFTSGELEVTEVIASVSLYKQETPRVQHGRTRRPKYVIKTRAQRRPGSVRPPHPLTMRLT